ncbi:hypothetical protein CQA51_22585 [Klebsiella pneumoniae]|nr:hypothetical protein CQA51_22585 [Klebsiella pneumoniae]
MGRLSNALLISLMYTALAIILDAVSIYYFKLNAPVTVVITTFLAVFGLTFEYLHATKRSELRFAERRKLQVECAKFSMMCDVLDSDTKLRFYKKVDGNSESSEFNHRYQLLQNEIRYWEKEIERLR